MTPLTNMQKAHSTALERAAAALARVDMTARCAVLGLPAPAPDGTLRFRLFGQDAVLKTSDVANITDPAGKVLRLSDRLIALHYLLAKGDHPPTGRFITFRELAGGQFYFPAFVSRTTRPLVGRIGNDLTRLQHNLGRFDHQLLAAMFSADLAVRVHAIGRIDITLLYHVGDDEVPASADILLDACMASTFETEDVAVLASRICIGLL